MIAALDVDYGETRSCVACVLFEDWTSEVASSEVVLPLPPDVRDYVPGEFYKRELPLLLEALERVELPHVVIVDGYVWLGPSRPGLGKHLHEELVGTVTVVGVAKSRFASNMMEVLPGPNCSPGFAVDVLRGQSKNPLYVTAEGMSPQEAAEHVRGMHGEFRIPTLLKRVDRLCRDG